MTGKHYYALARQAEESGLSNVAFVRLEQLCPFPTKELQEALAPFKRAKSEFQINEYISKVYDRLLNDLIPQNSCGARRSTATWALGNLSSRVSGTGFNAFVKFSRKVLTCHIKFDFLWPAEQIADLIGRLSELHLSTQQESRGPRLDLQR